MNFTSEILHLEAWGLQRPEMQTEDGGREGRKGVSSASPPAPAYASDKHPARSEPTFGTRAQARFGGFTSFFNKMDPNRTTALRERDSPVQSQAIPTHHSIKLFHLQV